MSQGHTITQRSFLAGQQPAGNVTIPVSGWKYWRLRSVTCSLQALAGTNDIFQLQVLDGQGVQMAFAVSQAYVQNGTKVLIQMAINLPSTWDAAAGASTDNVAVEHITVPLPDVWYEVDGTIKFMAAAGADVWFDIYYVVEGVRS